LLLLPSPLVARRKNPLLRRLPLPPPLLLGLLPLPLPLTPLPALPLLLPALPLLLPALPLPLPALLLLPPLLLLTPPRALLTLPRALLMPPRLPLTLPRLPLPLPRSNRSPRFALKSHRKVAFFMGAWIAQCTPPRPETRSQALSQSVP
jgi:hypothetical protein